MLFILPYSILFVWIIFTFYNSMNRTMQEKVLMVIDEAVSGQTDITVSCVQHITLERTELE